MPTNLNSMKNLHPAEPGWDLLAVTIVAVTGLLLTLAIAAATSLNFTEMPF